MWNLRRPGEGLKVAIPWLQVVMTASQFLGKDREEIWLSSKELPIIIYIELLIILWQQMTGLDNLQKG